MKAFIFSAILFLILIIIISANSLYIRSVCQELSESLSFCSAEDEASATEFLETWKRRRFFLSFSVHEDQLERMDDLSEGLKSAVASNDGAEFKKHVSLIKELIDELQSNEELSLQGILKSEFP